jgi:hypothetical protein
MSNKTKKCSHCHKLRELSEFYKNRSRFDGKDFYCRQCRTTTNLLNLEKKFKKFGTLLPPETPIEVTQVGK